VSAGRSPSPAAESLAGAGANAARGAAFAEARLSVVAVASRPRGNKVCKADTSGSSVSNAGMVCHCNCFFKNVDARTP